MLWYDDVQALYDTCTPPASSSPAANADVNGHQNELRQQSSGPETVAELQHPANDDTSHTRDQRRDEPEEHENNTSTR